jgi:hypothetical protein
MPQEDAITRLARQIDATTRSEKAATDAAAVAKLRREGAAALHLICLQFVASVNQRLSEAVLELSPAAYSAEQFRESGVNVMQISSQGRQMQITFHRPAELISTEKFLAPYVLEGEVRTYNQKMLERLEIRYLLVFFCVEGEEAGWRFYDWRTARTGPLSFELLVSLMEPLF